ncbi:NAD(P)-dependent oxidoreductase, partial [Burkholderia sp. SIMBA_019]|uniref:NAD(P)-dependent oxidoreductase n=1 Tax=Burkholderia sp. SIMBA_019 TaxID=3085765 RepID=UPI00397DB626
AQSQIISLHCPLTEDSRYLINQQSLAHMQPGAMLINTGRGGLVDTPALIEALKSGQLGYLGLDVYEEEAQLFFEDRSDLPLQDDVLARLNARGAIEAAASALEAQLKLEDSEREWKQFPERKVLMERRAQALKQQI